MTTGVSTAFTNNVTLTVDTWFNDVNKRTYGDFATVASHATAAPIWANGIHFIDYTGTAATTAFPNALQAGDSRTLICAAACTFTAGANMLIQGFASGEVFTAEAYDEVLVVAKTTTIFVLTIKQYATALATVKPLVSSGTGIIGTSKKVARQDHVHPSSSTPIFTKILASNAAWTPNPSTTLMIVQCCGGGGVGGVGGDGDANFGGGGGGGGSGGAGLRALDTTSTVSGTYNAVVGDSATSSSFTGTGISLSARSGTVGANGTVASSSGTVGSTGSVGGDRISGGAGGAGGGGGNSGAAGAAGAAGTANTGAGGGGGGGAGASSGVGAGGAGGAGGSGVIYVWEYA